MLFLTARSQDSDKTMGFSVGGDDYLVKPFSYSELISRVKAMLRRYYVYGARAEPSGSVIRCCGNIEIDSSQCLVRQDGREINLTDTEYRILLLLCLPPQEGILRPEHLRERLDGARTSTAPITPSWCTYATSGASSATTRRTRAQSAPYGERATALNKLRIKHGVSAQLMGAVLISLLAGAALFFVLLLLGTVLLDKTVYSRPFVESMSDRQFILLEAYVEDEEVTRDYLRPLDIWCSRGEKVYLSIYVDDTILYESLLTSKVRPDISNYDPSLEDPEREYELTLSDGTVTRTFLYYYTGDVYYYWVVVTASLAAFALFSLLFITLVHRKLRYIKQLKAELDILAGGDLGYEVTVRGGDELSELAHGIDEMRRSHPSAPEGRG